MKKLLFEHSDEELSGEIDGEVLETEEAEEAVAEETTVTGKMVEKLEFKRLIDAIGPFGQLDDFDLKSLIKLPIHQALKDYPKFFGILEEVVEKVSDKNAFLLKTPDVKGTGIESQIRKNAELLKMLAELFMSNGHGNQALRAFDAAGQILKEDWEIRWCMGEIYFITDHFDDAFEYYKEALELGETELEIAITKERIAETLVRMGDAEKADQDAASTHYKNALEYVRYSPAYCGLAWIALFNNDLKTAVAYFEMAKHIDPENKDADFGLSKCDSIKSQNQAKTAISMDFYFSLSRMARSPDFTFDDYLEAFEQRKVNDKNLS